MIITLPDGFNGHTEIFYSTPIDRIGDTVKLACASPGKEYMIRWVYIDQLKKCQQGNCEGVAGETL